MFATSGGVSIQRVDDSKTIQTASPPPDVTPELADAATGQRRLAGSVERGELARQAVPRPSFRADARHPRLAPFALEIRPSRAFDAM